MASTKTVRVRNTKKRGAGETLDDQTIGLNEPKREEIERRAYEIFLERGGVDGSDQDDWLQAERELKEAQS